MTKNQLQFNKNVEERRHNLEMEQQGSADVVSRRLQAQASQGQAAAALSQASTAAVRAAEEARHNVVAERQGRTKNIIEAVKVGGETIGTVAKAAKDITSMKGAN